MLVFPDRTISLRCYLFRVRCHLRHGFSWGCVLCFQLGGCGKNPKAIWLMREAAILRSDTYVNLSFQPRDDQWDKHGLAKLRIRGEVCRRRRTPRTSMHPTMLLPPRSIREHPRAELAQTIFWVSILHGKLLRNVACNPCQNCLPHNPMVVQFGAASLNYGNTHTYTHTHTHRSFEGKAQGAEECNICNEGRGLGSQTPYTMMTWPHALAILLLRVLHPRASYGLPTLECTRSTRYLALETEVAKWKLVLACTVIVCVGVGSDHLPSQHLTHVDVAHDRKTSTEGTWRCPRAPRASKLM